ncbi:hypothetical protein Patl1_09430 [Pistacia atlantica]|uniref:Uncharacterized protein n=1 Tax=Pistacia atlantica TaxID=434234 RepID=A0ACC1AJE4_9ROSI|nr:hypothetical protein Patl1_09430 [Pistacia atlantica]
MAPLNFNALRDLHNSANDLLHSPVIQKALVHHRQEKWVNEVSEASLRMLEVCGISKDVLLLVKEHLQDLQSTLRRVIIGESDISAKIAAYNRYRKKLKKQTLKSKSNNNLYSGVTLISYIYTVARQKIG